MGIKDYIFYQDDWATIYCGDCLEIMPLMEPESVDLVLTDPPYFTPASHYQSRISWGRSWGDLSILGQFFFDLCKEFKRIISIKGHLLVFCHDESYPVFYPVCYGLWDFTSALIWDKTRIGLGKIFRHQFEMILWASNSGAIVTNDGKLHSDILSYPATLSSERDHPVQKPSKLLEEIMIVCGNNHRPVLDPFLGSGTTLGAAKNLNRKSIGIEINPKYCEIAVKRLRQEVFDFRKDKE